jgi:GNAT superfamily N-acetyltransferase
MKEEPDSRIHVVIAGPAHIKYVYPILAEMEASAKVRGTGIAKRSPQALCQKVYAGKAVIALAENGDWAGFSYIESWGDGEFVSNSGLIVNPVYRGGGVATAIKREIFALSRRLYPGAKIFSITTGAAVLRLNHQFGFEPVTYEQVTRDQRFWDQCKHCVNHAVLESQGGKRCLCTAMMYTPAVEKKVV